MINIKNLNKSFNNKQVLANLNYVFEDSGLYLINGFNGCGKTTLLNILSMLDTEYSGEILVDGKNIKSLGVKQQTKFRKANIAYVLPKENLYSFLNLKQNLFLKIDNPDLKLIDGIDLSKYPSQISGGQSILVALTKTFNSNKKIVLLDEVTSQLDDAHTEAVMDILEKQMKEKLIIFVTHDSRLLNKYKTRVLTLKEGKFND